VTESGVRIVKGSPTETEVVALIAGLASVAATLPETEDAVRRRVRWRDPARLLGMSPLGRAGGRGEDEWRWSLR